MSRARLNDERGHAARLATFDVSPSELAALDRLDGGPDVRSMLNQMFVLASGPDFDQVDGPGVVAGR